MDRIEKRQKRPARILAEHEKVARNADKESKKDYKDRKKDDKEVKASKRGLWIMVRNLDETRADESRGREAKG